MENKTLNIKKKKSLKLNILSNKNVFEEYKELISYNGYNYDENAISDIDLFEFFAKIINQKDITSQILKEKCKETLNKFYDNDKFIHEINFLQKYPKFLPFYCNNVDLKVFESINIALIAFIIAHKITVISFYKDSKVLFYNTLNSKKSKGISIFAIQKNGINHFSRFLWNRENIKVNFDFNCLYSFKRVNAVYNKELFNEDLKFFNNLILKYLVLFPYVINFINQLNEKENVLNSAQKELKNVFHQYTKSVNKNSAACLNKAFSFNEHITLENLDQDTKNEVLFGDLSPSYYTKFNPPGLKPVDFKNNRKKSEDKEKANANANANSNKKMNGKMSTEIEKGEIIKFMADKNYGFIKPENKNTEIFFHYENIDNKADITLDKLMNIKNNRIIVIFNKLEYNFNKKKQIKAIKIKLIERINFN